MADSSSPDKSDCSSNYAYHVLQTLLKYPNKTILVVEDDAVTCKQFHSRVTNIAKYLKERCHLQPGDRVLLAVSPSVDLYCIAIAVLAMGGTLVLIDPSMGVERFNYCVGVSRSAMCLWMKGTKMKWLKYIFPAIKAIPKLVAIDPEQCTTTTDEYLSPNDVITSEHALITFTTGSTGMPKLLLRQHSFILFQSKCLSHTYEQFSQKVFQTEEVDCGSATNLAVFPLHYLKVGATVVLCTKFTTFDEARFIDKLMKYNIKSVGGSVAFVIRLAQYASNNNIMLPVQAIAVGGSPVFRGTLRTLANVVPNKKVLVLYGSTEVEPISAILAEDKMSIESREGRRDGLCVGLPAVNDSVRIIGIQNDSKVYTDPVDIEELVSPPNTVGEIIVSGWHVNTHQVEEKRLIHDKTNGRVWLRIEDAGYMDEEGFVWLVGRVKWRVERNGSTYWSTVTEQKILDRTSTITFVSYMSHDGKAYLFIEAPNGLPEKEREGLESYIKLEGIPVDELIIEPYIAKDRRHSSKPNTAVLFSSNNNKWNERLTLVKFILINNIIFFLVLAIILFLSLFYCIY